LIVIVQELPASENKFSCRLFDGSGLPKAIPKCEEKMAERALAGSLFSIGQWFFLAVNFVTVVTNLDHDFILINILLTTKKVIPFITFNVKENLRLIIKYFIFTKEN